MKKPLSYFIFHTSSFARGFTLIEVMLVVVITLIAAGVVIPKFKGTFKSTQMTDAVRSTVRMARYARSLSILQQETCTLRFEKNRMVLLRGTNVASPEASRKLPEDIKISSFENLADSKVSAGETNNVNFYAAGMNDGFKVTFSAGDDRHSTVICNPISGKTTVAEAGR
ncbi:MAG: prepilin-type N-terminal cleavage/methylation domain-containing protein [Verrucomicrobia bacterium]|nr:prepilin-type N-terminal cleavage/methylation domain-containing protein [Verrucomicrobiota bacterium]